MSDDLIGALQELEAAETEGDRLRAELALMERQRDHHAQLLDKSDAENWKLKTRLAAMTQRAETAEDTIGCQTDLEKDFSTARTENEALRKRVAELEALGKRMSLAADNNGLGWMPLFEEARATFQGIAELNND
jgi:chromosome segregation ATPase